MFKIISRIAIIGLLIGGAWYLWSNSGEKEGVDNEFVELEKTENPAKKSDDGLTFEIKKGDNTKTTAKNKDLLTRPVKEIENSLENNDVKIVDIETVNENMLTSHISKFTEGQESSAVTVYFYEYQIDLSTSEVPAGNVVFRAINNGRLSHNLTIKDGNGQIMFGRVAPGEVKYFQANLSKSELEVLSIGQADEEHNMVKELIVQ